MYGHEFKGLKKEEVKTAIRKWNCTQKCEHAIAKAALDGNNSNQTYISHRDAGNERELMEKQRHATYRISAKLEDDMTL